MKLFFLRFVFLFLFLQPFFLVEGEEVNIRRVSPPGGFTLGAIGCIVQDEYGYVWLGTSQGLIRYDSQNTVRFVNDGNNPLSLPHKNVNDILVDDDNELWVATNGGLCRYNRETESFIRISCTYENGPPASKAIHAFQKNRRGQYFLIDRNSFGRFDKSSGRVTRIATELINKPSALFLDKHDKLWIGTRSGSVFRYSPEEDTVIAVVDQKEELNCIFVDDGRLWIGTEGGGAKLYTCEGELLQRLSFEPEGVNSAGDVRSIFKDSQGRMWLGTYQGLFALDGKSLRHFTPDDHPGLPHKSVYSIYEDRNGVLWFGTWSGGVAIIDSCDNKFQTFRHSNFANSISNNMVSSFVQTGPEEILIGTEMGGLNRWDVPTKQFDVLKLGDLPENINIKALCRDDRGGIWVGTFRHGVWYRPRGADKFQCFFQGPDDGRHISARGAFSFCPVDSGVWIGTFLRGLNFYSFHTGTIRQNFSWQGSKEFNQQLFTVQSLLVDRDYLWVGTLQHFLFRVHLPSAKVIDMTTLSDVDAFRGLDVFDLYRSSSQHIWVGTRNKGILVYDYEKDSIKSLEADGIPDDIDVYGIIEDSLNNVWVSSNEGLFMYEHLSGSVRQFVYSDGIQSDLFMPQSVFIDDKGYLYCGGTNGFTRINPAAVKKNTRDLFVMIHSIVTNLDRKIVPRYSDRWNLLPVVLGPRETSFRVNFSADNYLVPQKNKYKYRLLNYYGNWVDLGGDGAVFITNLSAGEYVLQVMACNNDGMWSEKPVSIPIVIEKFWYKTNLALSLYALILLLGIYFIFRFYYERSQFRKQAILEKHQREAEEHIHEMKMKFFTNVSHEFRTPLTLILWPLKRIVNAGNLTVEQREDLAIVHRNTKRLLQLINRIVDFRKYEKINGKLNLSDFDLIDLVKNVHASFIGLAREKKIQCSLVSSYKSLEIEADREKLDMILFNLLSNAYKYTPEKGRIHIAVGNNVNAFSVEFANQLRYGDMPGEEFVEIAIEDSGRGIDSEDLFRIFNRFEQGKDREARVADENIPGSGIGLSLCKEYVLMHGGCVKVQSERGKGSRFVIALPLKQKEQPFLFDCHPKTQDLRTFKSENVPFTPAFRENRPHILVVEDNSEFQSLLCRFLSKYYDVECASCGQRALELMKEANIDLVVSDVMMPEMDGFEFCRQIKSQVETSHIPVIMLTALSAVENMVVGLDNGADAYLTKPLDENLLLKQIENILLQRQRIKENFCNRFLHFKMAEANSLDNFFLQRVKEVVEKNLMTENFGMDKLAEEMMMSRSQLYRKIKALSGYTTSDFVNLIRIRRAVELIQSGNYRLNEVAFLVGYNSQSYFTKCFKKIYKVTPKEYFAGIKALV